MRKLVLIISLLVSPLASGDIFKLWIAIADIDPTSTRIIFSCRTPGATSYKDVIVLPRPYPKEAGLAIEGTEGEFIECASYTKNSAGDKSDYSISVTRELRHPPAPVADVKKEVIVTDLGSAYYVVCCDPTGANIASKPTKDQAGIIAGNAATLYDYPITVKRIYHMNYVAVPITQ